MAYSFPLREASRSTLQGVEELSLEELETVKGGGAAWFLLLLIPLVIVASGCAKTKVGVGTPPRAPGEPEPYPPAPGIDQPSK
jgi:hypothetical protein